MELGADLLGLLFTFLFSVVDLGCIVTGKIDVLSLVENRAALQKRAPG